MFSLEFCKIFKSIYFVEHLRTTSSEVQQIEFGERNRQHNHHLRISKKLWKQGWKSLAECMIKEPKSKRPNVKNTTWIKIVEVRLRMGLEFDKKDVKERK